MLREQAPLLILALSFALAAGLVGCIALMKRMLLAGDVISHLALPGLGLATEAAIGVTFAAALAIGAAVTPSEDLAESLFGELPRVSLLGFLLGMVAVLFVTLSLFLLKDRLALSIFSPDLAAATGVNVVRLDLYFLLLFSLTVLVGLRFMGALLASALIIMPAATARQLTNDLWHFFGFAAAASSISVATGFLLNLFVFKFATAGPTIAILSALLFALSLFKKTG